MSKRIVSLCITILGVVLIILGILNIDNTEQENNNETKIDASESNTEEYEESLNINGDIAQSLIYYTRTNTDVDDIDLSIYSSDTLLTSNMNINYIFDVAFYRLDRLGELSDGVVEEDLVKEQINYMFGDYYSYQINNSFYYYTKLVKYNSSKKVYELSELDSDYMSNYVDIIESVYKYSNKIEITTIVAFVDISSTYSDVEMKNKISNTSITSSEISNYENELSRYKYTFMYSEEDDLYYYYSIEKVK